MGIERVILLALIASILISMASAIPGQATYYTPSKNTSELACRKTAPIGTLVAAVDPSMFNNGTACGKSYTIRCTGPFIIGDPQPCRNGNITVTVCDLCNGCSYPHFDLTPEGFSTIADPNEAGVIFIDYKEV
ncbi:hypothetical protein CASFOL_014506 [Castilleja foliolosa]|uniref:Expansin-like EG45 domain-containing protein n=1 Tax=Castilleja foliolosa TaxID=1961234 RepID=A0ABD3DS58_9LAMI